MRQLSQEEMQAVSGAAATPSDPNQFGNNVKFDAQNFTPFGGTVSDFANTSASMGLSPFVHDAQSRPNPPG